MSNEKIYSSKLGLRFRITPFQRPADGDVVCFAQHEWDWCLAKKLRPEEFKVIWMLKMNDYTYDPIPDEEKPKQSVAEKYSQEIIQSLKFRDVGKETEVREQESQEPGVQLCIKT